MSFLCRGIASIARKSSPKVFTRNFGSLVSCRFLSLVEFQIRSVADEEVIDVEVNEGTTVLDVCKDECVDITGTYAIRC